ncbi:uncharacterized protein YukE [Actinoplanes lutulentus]|uniref:Excreted virulence factor EspC (Type VII ESX diderm) n=1 Tax=Actinoplanes lutulentus TaxID=1287878 RepID=A0A327ZB61_9ACTN|nr:hypothetical protein [Actinoplanes lutulentus]MBB2946746.1 uncharacterized protein YukE [Actinoplanes lutulentus]RAK35638.1 excreted virulence factor EspC (type VII ESX diderm) [Actinoplanes lutulentus]
MSTLRVEPSALTSYAEQVNRARSDIQTVSSYITKWATDGTGGEYWALAQEKNAEAMVTISSTFYRLTCVLEYSEPELQAAASYYRATDVAAAANLDRALPDAVRMCPTPLEYENAGIICKPALFSDPRTPESNLIPPPEEPDSPVNRLAFLDYISPTSWIMKGLDTVLGFDPIQEVQNKIVGDWETFARMPSVLNSAATALHDVAINTQSGSSSLQEYWQGNAGDAAYRYFSDLSSAIDRLRAPLLKIGEEYKVMANAVWSAGDAIGGILKAMCDTAIIMGIAAVGGTVTAATGAGAAIGYGVAAVSTAAVLHQWGQITKYLALANTAIMTFRSALNLNLSDLDSVKLPIIGGGAGYDHPLTGAGSHV